MGGAGTCIAPIRLGIGVPEGGAMLGGVRYWLAIGVLGSMLVCAPLSAQQSDRKPKTKVTPVYPELAKKMGVSGVVKIEITVLANGNIKEAKVIGGHPLLAEAATDAVKKWKFETGPDETRQIIEFKFDRPQ
jgi:TonB family protein